MSELLINLDAVPNNYKSTPVIGGSGLSNHGKKNFDVDIRDNNLKLFVNIIGKYNIKYTLAWGTALGAVRNNEFIPYDDDDDIFITIEDSEKFDLKLLKELEDNGFLWVRRWRKYLLSFGKNGRYIDVNILNNTNKDTFHKWGNWHINKKFFEDTIEIDLNGTNYPICKEYNKLLKTAYGDNYMTPLRRGQYKRKQWVIDL